MGGQSLIVDHNGSPFSRPACRKEQDPCDARVAFGQHKTLPIDHEWLPRRNELVNESRKMYMRDGQLRGAVESNIHMQVGPRVRISPAPDKDLFPDSAAHRDFVTQAKRKFTQDARSTRCWFDSSGKMDLEQLLSLFARQYQVDGECLGVIREVKNPIGPVSFSVSAINTDRLYTPDGVDRRLVESGVVRSGVRRNAAGLVMGGYIHNRHPCEQSNQKYNYVPVKNSSGRRQLIHEFTQLTPDITRGISMIVSAVDIIRKKEKWTNAALDDAALKAELALVITSNRGDAEGVLDSGLTQDEYMESAMAHDGEMGISYGGKQLARLYDGEKLDGFYAQHAGSDFDAFCQVIDSQIARAMGMPLEYYTQRWSETNYSGARAGMITLWNAVEVMRQQVVFRISQYIYELWVEDNLLSGRINIQGMSSVDAWTWFVENRDGISMADWHATQRPEIDRAKMSAAYQAEMSLGVATSQRYCDEVLGVDWEDNMQQIVRETVRASEIMQEYNLGSIDNIKDVIQKRIFGGYA